MKFKVYSVTNGFICGNCRQEITKKEYKNERCSKCKSEVVCKKINLKKRGKIK